MIRINLLAVERERSKRRALIPAAHRVTIGASLILIVTALGIGWWFWSLRQASIQLDEDIARAELETRQLRSVLTQVQKFESRKAQLQQRVSLIEQLRRGQAGPVHVLDEVSKAIPERLWLTDLAQKDGEFVISGMTTSLNGLSDFVANLESSSWFKKPIDIVDSQVQTTGTDGSSEIFRFSVKATFQNPEAPAAPGPRPPGAAGAPGAAGVPRQPSTAR
jgi:type IV pilus assembly protein PilN